ncbi:MAG TPA: plasmid pRiA4b ORF-3 family protein, partial [Candidatus Mediterraneibacter stercoravium]|nr:plasmid pRiA4b ORF-3 family protein [Candidatus Mediterraneibacter stercoravium]
KIPIKGSHPPIWRRCIIPAGITFSQLAVLLNEIMGWKGYHLCLHFSSRIWGYV